MTLIELGLSQNDILVCEININSSKTSSKMFFKSDLFTESFSNCSFCNKYCALYFCCNCLKYWFCTEVCFFNFFDVMKSKTSNLLYLEGMKNNENSFEISRISKSFNFGKYLTDNSKHKCDILKTTKINYFIILYISDKNLYKDKSILSDINKIEENNNMSIASVNYKNIKGLRNIDNHYCLYNILQLPFYIEDLKDYFINGEYLEEIDYNFFTKGSLNLNIGKLIVGLIKEKEKLIYPFYIRNCIDEIKTNFMDKINDIIKLYLDDIVLYENTKPYNLEITNKKSSQNILNNFDIIRKVNSFNILKNLNSSLVSDFSDLRNDAFEFFVILNTILKFESKQMQNSSEDLIMSIKHKLNMNTFISNELDKGNLKPTISLKNLNKLPSNIEEDTKNIINLMKMLTKTSKFDSKKTSTDKNHLKDSFFNRMFGIIILEKEICSTCHFYNYKLKKPFILNLTYNKPNLYIIEVIFVHFDILKGNVRIKMKAPYNCNIIIIRKYIASILQIPDNCFLLCYINNGLIQQLINNSTIVKNLTDNTIYAIQIDPLIIHETFQKIKNSEEINEKNDNLLKENLFINKKKVPSKQKNENKYDSNPFNSKANNVEINSNYNKKRSSKDNKDKNKPLILNYFEFNIKSNGYNNEILNFTNSIFCTDKYDKLKDIFKQTKIADMYLLKNYYTKMLNCNQELELSKIFINYCVSFLLSKTRFTFEYLEETLALLGLVVNSFKLEEVNLFLNDYYSKYVNIGFDKQTKYENNTGVCKDLFVDENNRKVSEDIEINLEKEKENDINTYIIKRKQEEKLILEKMLLEGLENEYLIFNNDFNNFLTEEYIHIPTNFTVFSRQYIHSGRRKSVGFQRIYTLNKNHTTKRIYLDLYENFKNVLFEKNILDDNDLSLNVIDNSLKLNLNSLINIVNDNIKSSKNKEIKNENLTFDPNNTTGFNKEFFITNITDSELKYLILPFVIRIVYQKQNPLKNLSFPDNINLTDMESNEIIECFNLNNKCFFCESENCEGCLLPISDDITLRDIINYKTNKIKKCIEAEILKMKSIFEISYKDSNDEILSEVTNIKIGNKNKNININKQKQCFFNENNEFLYMNDELKRYIKSCNHLLYEVYQNISNFEIEINFHSDFEKMLLNKLNQVTVKNNISFEIDKFYQKNLDINHLSKILQNSSKQVSNHNSLNSNHSHSLNTLRSASFNSSKTNDRFLKMISLNKKLFDKSNVYQIKSRRDNKSISFRNSSESMNLPVYNNFDINSFFTNTIKNTVKNSNEIMEYSCYCKKDNYNRKILICKSILNLPEYLYVRICKNFLIDNKLNPNKPMNDLNKKFEISSQNNPKIPFIFDDHEKKVYLNINIDYINTSEFVYKSSYNRSEIFQKEKLIFKKKSDEAFNDKMNFYRYSLISAVCQNMYQKNSRFYNIINFGSKWFRFDDHIIYEYSFESNIKPKVEEEIFIMILKKES